MKSLDVTKLNLRPGRTYPLGATIRADGVQFAVFSRHATRVWLALFERHAPHPAAEFELDPARFRKGDVWTVFIEGLGMGAQYMYRMDGPPEKGCRFDPAKFLLDPYARLIIGDVSDGTARGVVVADRDLVEDDRSPRVPMHDTILYEVHVKGFTADPSSQTGNPGTYRGFIGKIPHLTDLGVTTVELLPVHHCGERLLQGRVSPQSDKPLTNYWGYQPIGYFAPDGYYASDGGQGAQFEEFRELVDALHRAGIEVIVDVVFNHTAEFSEGGPTLSFRGLDNAVYYHLDQDGGYKDFTGCGNTLNCNHPVVRDLILDCLRHWVTEFRVDGFRFDLACALNRDRNGDLHQLTPLVERITEDPVLRDVKLIAEPWDVAGGSQLGGFGGPGWAEWNSRFREEVRRFWRGDRAMKGDFARRLTGSPDLYQGRGRPPQAGINYVCAHDGFTLRDLVCYREKHNEANGDDPEDSLGDEFSWNCGAEGETADPVVETLRLRMQKNYLATLFLSLGVPMLLGGDEFGRTQRGNSNAYCQDNELSWFDWTLPKTNAELLRFCREMIRFRTENTVFTRQTFFTGVPRQEGGTADLLWFDAAGQPQTWQDDDQALACRVDASENDGVALYMMFNPSGTAVDFTLPKGSWLVRIDTSKDTPKDVPEAGECDVAPRKKPLRVAQKSMVVLDQKRTRK